MFLNPPILKKKLSRPQNLEISARPLKDSKDIDTIPCVGESSIYTSAPNTLLEGL